MATLNTPKVRIRWTNILTEGVDRDVVRGEFRDLALVMGPFVDASLYGNGFRFIANYRIIRATDNHVFNHFWTGDLDASFQGFGSYFWMSLTWGQARWAGAESGGGGWHTSRGMYLYKPYFVVDASQYSESLYRPTGLSEFGVAEDHFFWVE